MSEKSKQYKGKYILGLFWGEGSFHPCLWENFKIIYLIWFIWKLNIMILILLLQKSMECEKVFLSKDVFVVSSS